MWLLMKFVVLLVPFFKPSYFLQNNIINQLYNVLQIVVAGILIVYCIKNRKISKNIVYVIVIEFILLISSILNDLDIADVIKTIIQTVILCLMIDLFAERDLKKLFCALKLIFNVLIIADFVSALMYPTGKRVGLYDTWFLGAKNSHFMYILPALYCTYIYNFVLNKPRPYRLIEFCIILFMSCHILMVVDSATSIISIVLFLLLMLCSKSRIFSKITMKKLNIIYVILFVGLVFFHIQDNFAGIIKETFNKDTTLTGRTEIWSKSIEYIKQKPLLGYGLEPSTIRVVKMNNIAALNCHNMLLEVIYNGGITLLVAFIAFWIRMSNKVDKYSKKNNQILKAILVAYMVELFAEVLAFDIFLWVMILVLNIAERDEKKGKLLDNVKEQKKY